MNLQEKLTYLGDRPVGKSAHDPLYLKMVKILGKDLTELNYKLTGNQILSLINTLDPEKAEMFLAMDFPVSKLSLIKFFTVIGFTFFISVGASIYYYLLTVNANPDMSKYVEFVGKLFDFIATILPAIL